MTFGINSNPYQQMNTNYSRPSSNNHSNVDPFSNVSPYMTYDDIFQMSNPQGIPQPKFSMMSAFGNFVKGVFSPITSMFSSMKNFALSSGMLYLGSQVMKTQFAPLLPVVGTALGLFQGLKGLHTLFTSSNPLEKESAFYDMGASALSLGLSSYGSKMALNKSNVKDIDKLSKFDALQECFKQAPNCVRAMPEAIKTIPTNIGDFMVHLPSNASNIITNLSSSVGGLISRFNPFGNVKS